MAAPLLDICLAHSSTGSVRGRKSSTAGALHAPAGRLWAQAGAWRAWERERPATWRTPLNWRQPSRPGGQGPRSAHSPAWRPRLGLFSWRESTACMMTRVARRKQHVERIHSVGLNRPPVPLGLRATLCVRHGRRGCVARHGRRCQGGCARLSFRPRHDPSFQLAKHNIPRVSAPDGLGGMLMREWT